VGIDLTGANANAVSLVLVALIVGIFGFAGPIIVQRIQNSQRQKERREDKADRDAVAQQAQVAADKLVTSQTETADKLVKSNADVAAKLVENADATTPLLQEISKTGLATHQLVNNDRSIDKTYIAKLTLIIARLLPDDGDAQAAALEAKNDASRLPKPIDKT